MRALTHVRLLLVGVLLGLSGCVDERFDDGQFLCDPKGGSDECPSEMLCGSNGRCSHQPSGGGGGSGGNGGGGGDGCAALTCDDVGNQCGAISNGCGKLISCDCTLPFTCGGSGVTGECGCSRQKSITRSPTVLYDDGSVGSVAWSSVGLATASDDSWATSAAVATGETTHYLKANGFGFEFPPGATVTGVAIRVERSQASGAGTLADNQIRVLVGGQPLPLVGKKTDVWTSTDGVANYGGATQLWDATAIDAADVVEVDFGAALAVTAAGGSATPRVDHIEMTVHFEDPACPADGG